MFASRSLKTLGVGFIEGTDFADTIVGEGVSEFIEAGSGDDRVFGGAGSDDAQLGRGNDFFDGGADAEDFDTEAYMTNLGGNFGTFDAEQFFGDKFAIAAVAMAVAVDQVL